MLKRSLRGLPLVILLVLIGLVLSPSGRLFSESITLLADVWRIGRAPGNERAFGRITVTYAGPGEAPRQADVYCGGEESPGGRLLLVHGLVEAGKDDRRLRNRGAALGRHRYLVMVPEFPGMRSLRAGTEDIEEVEAALDALREYDDCGGAPVDRHLPVGVVGFSYSSGPVLLALDRPPRRADYAVLFGGYHDLGAVILFLTTGRHWHDGVAQESAYLPEGRWSLLEANAGAIADRADRETLIALARRRRRDPGADIADLVSRLGAGGRAALDLMTNTDPERFEALLGRTDRSLRTMIADLSPSKRLARSIDIDLFLLHARGDVIVPYTQSLELARWVRVSGTMRVALLGGFRNARPDDAEGRPWWSTALRHPGDSIRLLGTLQAILEHRRGT